MTNSVNNSKAVDFAYLLNTDSSMARITGIPEGFALQLGSGELCSLLDDEVLSYAAMEMATEKDDVDGCRTLVFTNYRSDNDLKLVIPNNVTKSVELNIEISDGLSIKATLMVDESMESTLVMLTSILPDGSSQTEFNVVAHGSKEIIDTITLENIPDNIVVSVNGAERPPEIIDGEFSYTVAADGIVTFSSASEEEIININLILSLSVEKDQDVRSVGGGMSTFVSEEQMADRGLGRVKYITLPGQEYDDLTDNAVMEVVYSNIPLPSVLVMGDQTIELANLSQKPTAFDGFSLAVTNDSRLVFSELSADLPPFNLGLFLTDTGELTVIPASLIQLTTTLHSEGDSDVVTTGNIDVAVGDTATTMTVTTYVQSGGGAPFAPLVLIHDNDQIDDAESINGITLTANNPAEAGFIIEGYEISFWEKDPDSPDQQFATISQEELNDLSISPLPGIDHVNFSITVNIYDEFIEQGSLVVDIQVEVADNEDELQDLLAHEEHNSNEYIASKTSVQDGLALEQGEDVEILISGNDADNEAVDIDQGLADDNPDIAGGG
jgi:hypothetical protein